MSSGTFQRLALVIHPARPIAEAVDVLQGWARSRGLDVVQIRAVGSVAREVAPPGTAQAGDLVVALGGDGTVLSALREAAAVDVPVLGVACGSLGALTAVSAVELADALERTNAGDWVPHRLPALAIHSAAGSDAWAVNDFVAVRQGAGQLVANVSVDGELYVRLAGDGVIVATPLGSSGYSMAAGGPVLMPDAAAFVVTPVAMHGGSAAPLVVSANSLLEVKLHPGFAGFEIEIDGHNHPAKEIDYSIGLHSDQVTLVAFGDESARLTQLRARHLIADSARVLARDEREAAG